jgi:hypothetical protein
LIISFFYDPSSATLSVSPIGFLFFFRANFASICLPQISLLLCICIWLKIDNLPISSSDDSSPGHDEQAQLLAKIDIQSKVSNGQGGVGTYGAIQESSTGPDARSNRPNHDKSQNRSEPAFPTLLNPALAATKSSKLGVFSGVFVPCVLSIWGIILFLRFGFIIAQAGVVGTMAMFIVGYSINIFTTLSLSAISTNGTVRGKSPFWLVEHHLRSPRFDSCYLECPP